MRNEGSLHPSNTIDNNLGLGILAIPLRELRDFDSRFVPAATDSTGTVQPAHVLSVCPVCGESPGTEPASSGVRVGLSQTLPRVLKWYCFSHRGSFDGIFDSIVKHQAGKREHASDLVLTEKGVSTKSDIDPLLPDHQAEYRCENPRRIIHHLKELGRVTAMPGRCRRCVPCASWLKTRRLGRLTEAVRDWASVRMVTERDGKAFASLSRRLRRRGDQYVSVPVEGGRVVLTDSPLDIGAIVSSEDVGATIEALVGVMVSGRISGTVETLRKRKKEDVGRVRIGGTKKTVAELEVVFRHHGCPKDVLERGRSSIPTWNVEALSPDELLGLWSACGIRVYERMAA